jgi:hemerythrin-like domain-containing protein
MSTQQGGPLTFFTSDHRACDAVWAELESAASAGEKERTDELFAEFDKAMRRHFEMEEQVLFPALEEAMNMPGMGPVQVMRGEHDQMRAVLDQMREELAGGDPEAMLDHGDTLLMLIQQHNVKEENILYPMAEQSLTSRWQELRQQLAKY